MVFKGRRRRRYGRNFFLSNLFLKVGGHYTLTIVAAAVCAALVFAGMITYQHTDHNDLLSRGRRLVVEQKMEAAKETFKQLVKNYRDSYEGHVELGKVYLDLGERDLAKAHFRKAADLKPRNLENNAAEIATSKLAVVQGRFEEGERLLMAAHEKMPKDRDVNLALFELYDDWAERLEMDNDFITASEKYELALQYVSDYKKEEMLKKRLVEVLDQQAIQKEKEQKLEEAIALLERSLRYRYDADTLVKVAEMYERNEKVDEAIDWYRRAFDANPEEISIKLARMLIAKGKLLLKEKKPDEADVFFKEADQVFLSAQIPLKDVYPVELSDFKVNISDMDYETGTLKPLVKLKVQNKSHREIPFLAVRVTFLSSDGVISEVTEVLASVDKPMPREGQKNSAKSLTVKPKNRINLHAIKSRVLQVKVSVAYTQDENAEWESIRVQDIDIRGGPPSGEEDPGYSA